MDCLFLQIARGGLSSVQQQWGKVQEAAAVYGVMDMMPSCVLHEVRQPCGFIVKNKKAFECAFVHDTMAGQVLKLSVASISRLTAVLASHVI